MEIKKEKFTEIRPADKAWTVEEGSTKFTDYSLGKLSYTGHCCLWDSIDLTKGDIWGLSCPCPKCSPHC
jgi:hypothetical protein